MPIPSSTSLAPRMVQPTARAVADLSRPAPAGDVLESLFVTLWVAVTAAGVCVPAGLFAAAMGGAAGARGLATHAAVGVVLGAWHAAGWAAAAAGIGVVMRVVTLPGPGGRSLAFGLRSAAAAVSAYAGGAAGVAALAFALARRAPDATLAPALPSWAGLLASAVAAVVSLGVFSLTRRRTAADDA